MEILVYCGIAVLVLFGLVQVIEIGKWLKAVLKTTEAYGTKIWDVAYDAIGRVQQEFVVPIKLKHGGKLTEADISTANAKVRAYLEADLEKLGIAVKKDIIDMKLPGMIEFAVKKLKG